MRRCRSSGRTDSALERCAATLQLRKRCPTRAVALSWPISRANVARASRMESRSLHHGDCLGASAASSSLPAESAATAFLKVCDAGKRRLQTLSLGFILRDRDSERTLGTFNRRRRIADLLIESTARCGRRILLARNVAPRPGHYRLEHGVLRCYEQRHNEFVSQA